ncbi:MAG: ABC transporter permease [Saprospiraceae bacterium]|nr:ABC transporter permease [Saprospiraceae bacterium]
MPRALLVKWASAKVIGALHNQLFQQFLGESTLVTFAALLLGLFGAYLLIPAFNQLTDRDMTFVFLENPYALAGLIGIGVLVSLISGSYPAFYVVRLSANTRNER